MPQPRDPLPKKPQTGLDYSSLKTQLSQTKLQQQNPALYQTIYNLIEGSRIFQGFLEERYNQNESNLSDSFNTIEAIAAELNDRNNTQYSVSLANTISQLLPDSVETDATFDVSIFDDGLMQVSPSEIVVTRNAQWMITIQCEFSQSDSA